MNYRNFFIGILIFFSFFLSKSGLVANAQYDNFGGYDYYHEYSYDYPYVYCDCDYDYHYYDDGYIVSAYDYTLYSYPTLTYPSVHDYPVAPYENYAYPSPPTPGVNDYPIAPYENYSYPLPPTPGVNDYPIAPYENYSYPAFSGNYLDLTTPRALATVSGETVAHAQSASEIPTGPDDMLPWILLGGFVLSVAVYLIIFKLRFNLRLKFSGNYSGAVLEKRLKEIRNRELTPDTNDFQF